MSLPKAISRFSLVCVPLLATTVVVQPVYAIDFGSSAEYRFETSDNIDRVTDSEDATNGATHEIIGEFSGSTRAQKLDLDFDLSLSLSQDNGVDDEQNSDIRASLYGLYNLRPGQISWLFADFITEQGEDLTELANRDDRFLSNFFITGPTTTWRITPVDSFNFDLFYLLGDEQGDPEQTRQLLLRSDWSHRFSRRNTLGLHFENTDISFKESEDEFGIRNIFARYTYVNGQTTFEADAGISSSTDFEPADNSDTTRDEGLLRLGFGRQISRVTTLSLEASQKFTDESISTVRDLQTNADAGLSTSLGPFFEERLAFSLDRSGDIWNAALGLSNTNLEFVDILDADDDRTETLIAFDLGYALTSVWGLQLSTAFTDIDYDNIVLQEEELSFNVAVSYQLSAAWGTSFGAYFDRIDSEGLDADTGLQEDDVIDEQGVSFSIYWQPVTKLNRLREKYQSQGIENVLQ